MYNKIKHDIAQDYYMQNYPNDGQRFVAWYLRNIHNLDAAEAKSCITDGAGDKQIDAVYVNEQNETVYIIQGKFYSSGKIDSDPLREVLSSWFQIKDLKHLQENANDKLKAKISEISSALDDGYNICFELIAPAELTEAAEKDLEVFSSNLVSDIALNANLVVVDNDTLKARYDEALNINRPYINHSFQLEAGKYIDMTIGTTRTVIAAIPLKDCVKIPGIKDGSLFRKNVRQSLGSSNKVNKDIARTLRTNPGEFFFLHNGITAICSSISIDGGVMVMSVKDLNVVNGCQSLTTIYNSSEAVKKANDAYIMFRFYEIDDTARADTISTSTNSQTAVKARDLRSNDKYVLTMKREYERQFTDGYFITKRGEAADPAKYNTAHTVDLTLLGKLLIAWHSQRPTISYSESKIFDKYFDQLFHRAYSPANINALFEIYRAVYENWKPENPLGLNESLLAMKAYAPYHHFFAMSVIFCEINNMPDTVPDPSKVLALMKSTGLFNRVIKMAGKCLNQAFKIALREASQDNKVFSATNWVKAKTSLKDIRLAVANYIMSLDMSEDDNTLSALQTGLKMNRDDFSPRWAAD